MNSEYEYLKTRLSKIYYLKGVTADEVGEVVNGMVQAMAKDYPLTYDNCIDFFLIDNAEFEIPRQTVLQLLFLVRSHSN